MTGPTLPGPRVHWATPHGATKGALVPPTGIEERLPALQAHYTALINAAVGADRMDLVQELADAYQDEALGLLVTLESDRAGPTGREVEILELGRDRRPSRRSFDRFVGARLRRWRHRRR